MLTANETHAAQQFWDWFKQNHLPFEFFENMPPEQQEDHMDQLSELVAGYSDGLDIQIGKNLVKDGPEFRLIISANGQIPYFGKAKSLAALAPELPNWQVYALLPPLPEDVFIRFQLESGILDPRNLWFLPMEAPEEPSFFGVHIGLSHYDHYEAKGRLDELNEIVIQLVANILGEESWAIDIQHLEIGSLPPDPEEEGFLNLYELPAHILEFRQKWPSPIKQEG